MNRRNARNPLTAYTQAVTRLARSTNPSDRQPDVFDRVHEIAVWYALVVCPALILATLAAGAIATLAGY
jgi:hypothetical protein